MALDWRWWRLCLAVRLLNGILVRTWYTPDEFWQGEEVAHYWAFGCGSLTWEWQPQWKIRGATHPLLLAGVYRFLEAVGLDCFVGITARFLQSFLASVADVATYSLALRTFGPEPAKYALFCQLVNWFNGYVLVRPYSNSLEAVVMSMVFIHFVAGSPIRTWLGWGAFCCMLRPTAAVTLLPLWITSMMMAAKQRTFSDLRWSLLVTVILLALGLLGTLIVDRIFYGEWTLTMWNFVKFNLVEGNSALYGTHPPWFYLVEGLPAMLGTMLPCLFFADYRLKMKHDSCGARFQAVLLAIILTIVIYSFTAHKELRFILPCMPPLMVLAGEGLCRCLLRWAAWRRQLLAFIVLSNVVAFGFLALVHQRAPLSIMEWLHFDMTLDAGSIASVDFLTNCHATPFQAKLHRGRMCLPMRYLDCSPYLGADGVLTRSGTDSDRFEREGSAFLQEYYNRTGSRHPRYVVTSLEALPSVVAVLPGYGEVGRSLRNQEGSEGLVLLRSGPLWLMSMEPNWHEKILVPPQMPPPP